MSVIGRAAAIAASAERTSAASSSDDPTRACAAASATITVGPTAPSAMRADVQRSPSSVTDAPTPTTAMSISLRGMNLW